jgi:glyoxylase-like metal-dependent hydrolase (beta-lactamase superfamily II)
MVNPALRAHVEIGDTTITYLPDGHARMDPSVIFPSSVPDGWATHAAYLGDDGRFPVSIGSFLVRTGDRTILVDLGLGDVAWSAEALRADFVGGTLLQSLAAEGLRPDDVDTVVFTHLHHDHVGWVSDVAPFPGAERRTPSGLTFGRARHLVSEQEWQHWVGTDEVVGPDPAAVQAPLRDRIEFVADGDEIAPGVHVLATPGHTPGHHSLVVTDPTHRSAERVVILGDVMHCQVQVTESQWTFVFDADPELGVATREQLLKDLESEQTILAGGHFAGHVFGRVLPAAARRAWASGRVSS